MTTVITGLYGPFRYTPATDTWWWADDLYRIHGFEPGEIVPTTALLVAHKHPDDAAVASAIIRNAFTSGESFALWHRILDARRRLRQVVSVGDGHWEDGVGRTYATAMALIVLQMPCEQLPIFQK